MDDWTDVLVKAGIELKGMVLEVIEQHCADEVAQAKGLQRENDILSVVLSYIELKVPDLTILEMLQKYFGIESISEGKGYIFDARSFNQTNQLKEYLGLKGMDWIRYRNEHALNEKLKSNPKLLELSPEKLKAALEK